MITQAEIKQIRSLREKKFRDAYGLFVVEGEKLVQEALSSGLHVVKLLRREEIGEAAMARISQFSTPSPVLAVVQRPEAAPAAPENGLCLALDGVRDPGNLGTIVRIADWFGVETVFASEDCVDLYNPKVIQSSMGSLFRVRFVPCDLVALCRRFRAAGRPVWQRSRRHPPRGGGGSGRPPVDTRFRPFRRRIAERGRRDGRNFV